MKYIYKHGNQYWYQRAVPAKLSNLLGRKTLKISLKTNKVPTAIKRAKLQALEHKKMFKIAENSLNKYFKTFFNNKEFDWKNKVKFFSGYSGWTLEQLSEEVKEGSWIIDTKKNINVFENNVKYLWKDKIKNSNSKFRIWLNTPNDPQDN